MRAVIQRVHSASVHVESLDPSCIGAGLLVYLGVGREDGEADLTYLVDKVAHLRIFSDNEGKMNLDVTQIGGEVLVVSAFTTQADARKGRRPSFDSAANADLAVPLYDRFVEMLRAMGLPVKTGVFQAMMNVESVNDGPICILLDSKRLF